MICKYILLLVLSSAFVNTYAQSYSLDSCKVLAIENNRKLKEAKMKVGASEQVKKEAFTNYFPTVEASGFFFKSTDYLFERTVEGGNLPVYDGNVANLAGATQFAYSPSLSLGLFDYLNMASVTAAQPVYAGSQIMNGNKMANIGVQISTTNLDLTEEEIKVKTEELFWVLISLKEKMNTLLKYQELVDKLLVDVQVAYDAGLIYKSDLLKVLLKKNELKTNKLQLQNGIDIVSMSLCQHIGVLYVKSIVFHDQLDVDCSPLVYNSNINESIANRKEIQMLGDVKNIEELKYKMIRGSNMPQLAVGVSGVYLDSHDNTNTNLLAFAKVSIPISDWWGGKHKMRQQKIQIDIAQNKLDDTKELLAVEISKNFNDLNEAYERIKVARNSIEQAEEHHRVMNDNYSAGLVNTSDLLEAQAMLQHTKDAETEALTNYKIRLAYYLKSISELK